jgi:hypothetical protein
MTIEATIVADSISPDDIRLTTFQLRYPRFIHAELMTHRMFSRNASSSRAIPVKRMIEDLRRDPAMPVYWGSNKPGMQAGEQLDEQAIRRCQEHWLNGRDEAIKTAKCLIADGLHKQIANRILEPWAHINVVVTATDYENFFTLRRHKDAQPELKVLADAMYDAMQASEPKLLQPGEWHLPFVRESDLPNHPEALKAISVARCARVSYLTHDGRETTPYEDLQLYDRLVGTQPLHASPAEHQATPDRLYKVRSDGSEVWNNPELHGNFRGWVQLRKQLPGEYVAG